MCELGAQPSECRSASGQPCVLGWAVLSQSMGMGRESVWPSGHSQWALWVGSLYFAGVNNTDVGSSIGLSSAEPSQGAFMKSTEMSPAQICVAQLAGMSVCVCVCTLLQNKSVKWKSMKHYYV